MWIRRKLGGVVYREGKEVYESDLVNLSKGTRVWYRLGESL